MLGDHQAMAAGSVSVVLAQDGDLFSREPAYSYLLRRELEERGCILKALNDTLGYVLRKCYSRFSSLARARACVRLCASSLR